MEVFFKALAARIQDGQMELTQVPEIFRAEVEELVTVEEEAD